MSVDELMFILKIGSGIIIGLIGVSIFFLKNTIITVSKLKEIALRLETSEKIRTEQNNTFQVLFNNRLDAYIKEIQAIEKRLTVLETRSEK